MRSQGYRLVRALFMGHVEVQAVGPSRTGNKLLGRRIDPAAVIYFFSYQRCGKINSRGKVAVMTTAPYEPAPFTGEAATMLAKYYQDKGVEGGTVREKTLALKIELGDTQFYSYGGGETDALELRATEHVFLLEKGLEV
jgi:hypothetical protein